MKKAIIIVLALALVIGALIYWRSSGTSPESSEPETTGSETTVPDGEETQQEKVVNISAMNYSFNPSEIRVKKGEKVKIVLENKSGFHDWVLDEFNARTERTNTGGSATVEFVADKAGTFKYYCSVGNHRQLGMEGILIVE